VIAVVSMNGAAWRERAHIWSISQADLAAIHDGNDPRRRHCASHGAWRSQRAIEG
jgi:hypothetical protein